MKKLNQNKVIETEIIENYLHMKAKKATSEKVEFESGNKR